MKRLLVFVERHQQPVLAGYICGNDRSDAAFSYDDSYLSSADAAAISVSLPLSERAFSPSRTEIFFDGLLPEAFTRKSIAQRLGVDEDDYLSLLSALGQECIGALRITEDGAAPVKHAYRKLSSAQIATLAAEDARAAGAFMAKARLSLAGASGKVGLYYDEQTHDWYLPLGDAPSTHIVKQSHVRLKQIVLNELLCMKTAARMGLYVAGCDLISTGGTADSDILFSTKRFDREFPADGARIGTHKRPSRLHQEDFAQALGIRSVEKYEPADGAYLPAAFDLLARVSADPITDLLRLWDMLVFSVLIGNTDFHLKNISLLYDRDFRCKRLAPAYDQLSTVIYDSLEKKTAFRIGGEALVNRIDDAAFMRAAKQARIGADLAMERVRTLRAAFPAALKDSTKELSRMGYPDTEQIRKRLMACYNSASCR